MPHGRGTCRQGQQNPEDYPKLRPETYRNITSETRVWKPNRLPRDALNLKQRLLFRPHLHSVPGGGIASGRQGLHRPRSGCHFAYAVATIQRLFFKP